MRLNPRLLHKISTICLMTAWLFSSMQLSQIISGEITAMFSMKIPNKQINTLEELITSKMELVAFDGFMNMESVQDKSAFHQIKQKVERDRTSITIDQLFMDKKWIVDTSLGKTAILLATTPLKMIITTHLKSIAPGTKFRFLDERYRHPLLITLCASMRLSRQFRGLLNRRLIFFNSEFFLMMNKLKLIFYQGFRVRIIWYL